MKNRANGNLADNDNQTIVFSVAKLREIANEPPGRVVYYSRDTVILVPEDAFCGLQSRGNRLKMSVAALLRDKVNSGWKMPAEWMLTEADIPRWKAAYGRRRAACSILEGEGSQELREAA